MESFFRKIVFIVSIIILIQNFLALFFNVTFVRGQGFVKSTYSLNEILFSVTLLLLALSFQKK